MALSSLFLFAPVHLSAVICIIFQSILVRCTADWPFITSIGCLADRVSSRRHSFTEVIIPKAVSVCNRATCCSYIFSIIVIINSNYNLSLFAFIDALISKWLGDSCDESGGHGDASYRSCKWPLVIKLYYSITHFQHRLFICNYSGTQCLANWPCGFFSLPRLSVCLKRSICITFQLSDPFAGSRSINGKFTLPFTHSFCSAKQAFTYWPALIDQLGCKLHGNQRHSCCERKRRAM